MIAVRQRFGVKFGHARAQSRCGGIFGFAQQFVKVDELLRLQRHFPGALRFIELGFGKLLRHRCPFRRWRGCHK